MSSPTLTREHRKGGHGMPPDALQPHHEPAMRRARRIADRDLHQLPNTPTDIAWLYTNPVLWLRALIHANRELELKVNQERRTLAAQRPQDGHRPSPAYLAAKQVCDRRLAEHAATTIKIKGFLEDAKVLLGPEPVVGYLIPGDLVALMLELAEKAIAGDLDGITQQTLWWADQFTRQEMYVTKAVFLEEEGPAR